MHSGGGVVGYHAFFILTATTIYISGKGAGFAKSFSKLEEVNLAQLTGVTRQKVIIAGWQIKLDRAGNIDVLAGVTESASQEFMDQLNEVQKTLKSTGSNQQLPASSLADADVTQAIRKLKELADDGIISPTEFEMKKQELLGRI